MIKKPDLGCVPVALILATQKAEIRRIAIQSQPRTNSSQDPILKKPNTKKGLAERLKQ
jgi:hypothetical protein